MKILVTGGCGFIGSHTIVDLLENGFEVVNIDNNVRSNAGALEGIEAITGVKVPHYQTDLCDLAATRKVFAEHPDIEGIVHFAAYKAVGESVEKPVLYYQNNLNSLANVLTCVEEFGVKHFIFSSSCSVYGNADELPVTEATPMKEAESPYAHTKQIGEGMIQHFAKVHPETSFVALRYFNPAGAHPSALIGEASFDKPTNLVPVITDTASGVREKMVVFGTDYNTRDGSCIRDYIYIMDLANAHTKSIQYLQSGKNKANYEVFNVGIGEGVTVLEAIRAFEKVTGISLNYELVDRRPGDVEAIYSNYKYAAEALNWTPKGSIEDIMQTAWQWQQKRPEWSFRSSAG